MDKTTVRKQKDLAKEEKLAIDMAAAELLKTRQGRHYLWWLLRIGRIGAQPFAANALVTSFACGELNVGQQILAHIIEVNPAGYAQMIQEKANDDGEWRRLNRDRNSERGAGDDGEDDGGDGS